MSTPLTANLCKVEAFCTPLLVSRGSGIRYSAALWQEMLEFLTFFATAAVDKINIHFMLFKVGTDTVENALYTLRQFAWSHLVAILHRSRMEEAHIIVRCNVKDDCAAARQYLALVEKEIRSLQSKEQARKVRLEWERCVNRERVTIDWEDLRTQGSSPR